MTQAFWRIVERVIGASLLLYGAVPLLQHSNIVLRTWYMSILGLTQVFVFIVFLTSNRPSHSITINLKVVVGFVSLAIGIACLSVKDEGPVQLYFLRMAVLIFYGCIGLWGFATIGRSFGILPGVRAIVGTGPFKYVRHPIYLAYLHTELIVIMTRRIELRNIVGVTLIYLGFELRVRAEEEVLAQESQYVAMIEQTPRRLFHPLLSLPAVAFFGLCCWFWIK